MIKGMMKDVKISWTTLFMKEYVWVKNCVRVVQIFCLKEENAQQFWTCECVLNLSIWVLLGCSNMGIVVAIVKLLEVYLQDSGDFWITKSNFSCLSWTCSFCLLRDYVGHFSVGVVHVTLGYFATTIDVMGGLVLRETLDVPIWLFDVQESEIRTIWPL